MTNYIIILEWPGADGGTIVVKMKAPSIEEATELSGHYYKDKKVLAVFQSPVQSQEA